MITQTNPQDSLAIDTKDIGRLRRAAQQNSPEALRETAKQFEALFLNMVMKSMRDATPHESPFDSQQSQMYTSMLDQQLSQNLASKGVGLADVLVRQLSKNANPLIPLPAASAAATTPSPAALQGQPAAIGKSPNVPAGSLPTTTPMFPNVPARAVPASSSANPANVSSPVAQRTSQPAHVKAFQQRLSAHADEASRTTGIPAKFMLGQAALESGWGKREILAADGSTSFNLFGIKATGNWKGKVVETTTTEYVNGTPQKRVEKFRAYDSYADAFRDYANLLRNNPRYKNVLANAQDATSFAQGLQRAGYATDPNYATKLARIIKQSLSA